MEEQLTNRLSRIVESVQILSPSSLSFAGLTSTLDEPGSDHRRAIIQHLGQLLYLHCYCRNFTGVISTTIMTSPSADHDFVDQLSAANSSRDYLNRGWRLLKHMPTGHYVAEKNGMTRVLFAGEFVAHADIRGPVTAGTPISIFCPRESRTMHPGFYYVFGESIGDQQDDSGLLRLYWHLQAEGAVELVRLLTEHLNHFQIPFRLKVVNDPAGYDRTDAAVLYLNEKYFHTAKELIDDVHQRLLPRLDNDTPLFSKQLGFGLGLAEEPTTGESFGQQRCRLLAESLWSIYELGLKGAEEKVEQINKHFSANGFDLDFPHQNPKQ